MIDHEKYTLFLLSDIMKDYLSTFSRFTGLTLLAGTLAIFLFFNSVLGAQDGFDPLFNGKDLDGWEGQGELWEVRDGLIVGSTEGRPIENNSFLIYLNAKPANFHLKVKLKLMGNNNSGIMYRAQDIEGISHGLSGPQMDIHPKLEYQGMYYSEKTGRGIIAQRGQKVSVSKKTNAKGKTTPKVTGQLGKEPDFDLSEWNEYEVVAVNKRHIHLINGVVTVDVTDRDPSTASSGAIGIQLHQGPPMTVEVKDIALKPLRGAEARETIRAALERPVKKKMKGSPKD